MVNAIARSRVRPERAEAIVRRIEELYGNNDMAARPDVVCYNALLNAFGWSNSTKGKAKRCFDIYLDMRKLYESGRNLDVKPDIITCNSILNACAFEDAVSETESAIVMEVVAKTLEDFQSAAPNFGWPNFLTYSHVLLT